MKTQHGGGEAAADSFLPPDEFLEMLSFNFDEASIWLGDRRMMMVDVATFAELRRHLIDAVGIAGVNRAFARMGFEAGMRDAKLMHTRWPGLPGHRRRYTTLSPHRFQGITKLEIVSSERDASGRFIHGEWRWHRSVEADAHVSTYGRAHSPVCFMEVGYATGHSYALFGNLIGYREIACSAMGSEACTVIGKRIDTSADLEGLSEFDFLLPLVAESAQGSAKAMPQRASPIAKKTQGSTAAAVSDVIIGGSPALTSAKQLLESVAPTDATVLISGESGVGKELFTRNLHRLSKRAEHPFIAINCAAIPETLIEAELFGVERGAFTGATESRAGRFERANGGTLFLDEIGSLPLAAQVKLLRAIQEREIERIGGTKPIKVNVRIVAAHNVPLRNLVDGGEFREDLFYRLNVFPIHIPPLRNRREDIRDLLAHYLSHYNRTHGRSISHFTYEATKALLNYDYPGNIRELQNLVERAVILTSGDAIDVADIFSFGESFSSHLWSVEPDGSLKRTASQFGSEDKSWGDFVTQAQDTASARAVEDSGIDWPRFEEELFQGVLEKVMAQAGGNIAAAARRLGLKRHQLEYRLKRREQGTDPAEP